MSINKYLNLITSEHKTKQNFMSWLSANLSLIDDTANLANNLITYFDIDNATGVQLDQLGEIIGITRTLNFQPLDGSSPLMDDNTYRLALKAKISQNVWDGTISQVYSLFNNLLPDLNLQIVDNQDMTEKALIQGTIDSVTQQLLTNNLIIPKPEGVELNVLGLTIAKGMPYTGGLVTTTESITLPVHPITWAQKDALNLTFNQLDALNLNWTQTEFYKGL